MSFLCVILVKIFKIEIFTQLWGVVPKLPVPRLLKIGQTSRKGRLVTAFPRRLTKELKQVGCAKQGRLNPLKSVCMWRERGRERERERQHPPARDYTHFRAAFSFVAWISTSYLGRGVSPLGARGFETDKNCFATFLKLSIIISWRAFWLAQMGDICLKNPEENIQKSKLKMAVSKAPSFSILALLNYLFFENVFPIVF